MTTKEHPHAELLRAIADGKTIINAVGRVAPDCALELIAEDRVDRLDIAPDTITVNGITVPAPYRGPMENGQKYWVADPSGREYVLCARWYDDDMDRIWMARGLIHLDAAAAAAHGRAMTAASSQEGGAA